MTVPDVEIADLPLRMLFNTWPAAATVFLSHRMLCLGCPIAPFHTVVDACQEYGLNEARFRCELRAAFAAHLP